MTKKIIQTLVVLTLVALAACLPANRSGESDLKVLPALQQAGLKGKILMIQQQEKGNRLLELDVTNGQTSTLFAAPEGSWLGGAALSPDSKQIILAYTPKAQGSEPEESSTNLYRIPADGSGAPQVWLAAKTPNESYSHPTWSPDGQFVYYTHNAPVDSNGGTSSAGSIESRIEKASPAGGEAQVILKDAMWPRLSPDGKRLAYLSVVRFTSINELYLANADGSDAKPAITGKKFEAVDDHLFSPDGSKVYFSAVGGQGTRQIEPPGFHLTFGVLPVFAHNEPSDWFQVSADGGAAQQVTHVQDTGMAAAFSPDGQWIAYVSQKGLFLMKPDGSQLTQLAELAATGSITWVP